MMLFKKSFTQDTVNGVQMGNGTVSFQGIKLNVHSFFLDGVLIDTGGKTLEKYFVPFFNDLKVEKVVITHFHEDHTGCAAYLQKELGLPIFMDKAKIDYCGKKGDYPFYRQVFWGKREAFQATALGDTFNSSNATWSVIRTPGHAIDHLAFLNQDTGQLFTGDLYCQEKTKVVLREESIPKIIDSIKKVLTFDFKEVLCSHAGYLKDGRKVLNRKLDYLLDLEGTIINLYEEGKTPEEINSILFSKRYPITFFSGGEWSSVHIVRSILRDKALIT